MSLTKMADDVFGAVKGWVAKELGPLAARVGDVEQRTAAVEDTSVRRHAGALVEVGKTDARVTELFDLIKAPPAGPQGPPGTPGEPGATGVAGPVGERGTDGVDGRDGAAGADGKDGAPGRDAEPVDVAKVVSAVVALIPKPENGRDGKDGSPGEPGPAGINGKDGQQGVDGKCGPIGERGAAGLSAFELSKASGFVGSEAEWLLTLRGKDGANGKDGVGQDGRDGRDGEKGDSGRDALEIDIIDGVDLKRSYPRGTFAAFHGGTFRAVRATDPLDGKAPRDAGWMCTARGVFSDVETLEDGGRFKVRTVTYSDSTVSVQRNKTQMLINRGVYQVGADYDVGDVVTSDGSQWATQKDTNTRPPGTDWRLCVKHGKDGKDGGEGRAGRDLTQLGPDGAKH